MFLPGTASGTGLRAVERCKTQAKRFNKNLSTDLPPFQLAAVSFWLRGGGDPSPYFDTYPSSNQGRKRAGSLLAGDSLGTYAGTPGNWTFLFAAGRRSRRPARGLSQKSSQKPVASQGFKSAGGVIQITGRGITKELALQHGARAKPKKRQARGMQLAASRSDGTCPIAGRIGSNG